MDHPYCVFCGETVAEGDAVICPSCGRRGCRLCADAGHCKCPNCKVEMVAEGAPEADAETSAPQSDSKHDKEVSFDVHHVDPDRWRGDSAFGKPASGPTIVFTGVLCGLLLLIGTVTVAALYSTGRVSAASLHLPNAAVNISPPNLKGTWDGEFDGQTAVLYIAGQDGRKFYGSLKRRTTDGSLFKTPIDGSINGRGEITFVEQRAVGKDAAGQPVKCVARGTLSRAAVKGESSVLDKKFNWHFSKNAH